MTQESSAIPLKGHRLHEMTAVSEATIPLMPPLSWNEIKSSVLSFSRDWADEVSEDFLLPPHNEWLKKSIPMLIKKHRARSSENLAR
jgi:cell pole-organizing protein PopZ